MRTSVNVLLLSLQVYNCFLIKIHTYASFWFRSLHFKKQALRLTIFWTYFFVLSEIFTVVFCWIHEFQMISSGILLAWEWLICAQGHDPKLTIGWKRPPVKWETTFLIQATGYRVASKNAPTASVSSAQISKFGIMCPIICFIAFVNCLC